MLLLKRECGKLALAMRKCVWVFPAVSPPAHSVVGNGYKHDGASALELSLRERGFSAFPLSACRLPLLFPVSCLYCCWGYTGHLLGHFACFSFFYFLFNFFKGASSLAA